MTIGAAAGGGRLGKAGTVAIALRRTQARQERSIR